MGKDGPCRRTAQGGEAEVTSQRTYNKNGNGRLQAARFFMPISPAGDAEHAAPPPHEIELPHSQGSSDATSAVSPYESMTRWCSSDCLKSPKCTGPQASSE
ncbi:hypothetical protein LF63_0112575 [Oleiagrimonas soli]|uniref:Uncharacterized protein n=1 Tax=Oleiagrimonas soli TaxID=1543381 RepID=A0A099CTT8_9GAMM|nr:hypothetical protein LF63_0112575 [Oleiagrimonas soli]